PQLRATRPTKTNQDARQTRTPGRPDVGRPCGRWDRLAGRTMARPPRHLGHVLPTRRTCGSASTLPLGEPHAPARHVADRTLTEWPAEAAPTAGRRRPRPPPWSPHRSALAPTATGTAASRYPSRARRPLPPRPRPRATRPWPTGRPWSSSADRPR